MAVASCHFCMISIDQYSFVLITFAVFDYLVCFFNLVSNLFVADKQTKVSVNKNYFSFPLGIWN